MNEKFNCVLITEPVAAGDRIVKVIVKTVVVLDDAGSAALRCDGVTAHGIDLGYQSDAQAGIRFGERYCGPQAGTTGADDRDIAAYGFHTGQLPTGVATTFW
jgi:hypothetical protein